MAISQRVQRFYSCLCCGICLSLMVSCERTNCDNPGLRASFQGFDSSELSYVIVEKYQKGTGFTTLDNRKVYGTAIVNATDDSVLLSESSAYLWIDHRFDTYVRVTNANKEFKIRDVSYTNEKVPLIRNPLTEVERCSNTVSGSLNDERFEGKGSNYFNSSVTSVEIKLVK